MNFRKHKFRWLLFFILCWLGGDILEVYFSWIYFRYIDIFRLVITYGGMVGVFGILFGRFIPSKSEMEYWPGPQKRMGIFITMIFCVFVFTHMMLIFRYEEYHISNLFSERPTGNASAIVKERIKHHSKSGSYYSLLINYKIQNENYEQEIPSEPGAYTTSGDSVRIQYLIENPMIVRKKQYDEK